MISPCLESRLRALASYRRHRRPTAWVPVRALPSLWGTTPEDAETLLAGLVAAGWLERWVDPKGRARVILSPRGASALGVVLVRPENSLAAGWWAYPCDVPCERQRRRL